MTSKKGFNRLKTASPQTDENEDLNAKVLDNAGDLFNGLYYIYKDQYNEEKDGLNTKDKKLGIKELPKKSTKDDLSEFNEWANKNETDINLDLFKKHYNFQRPSDMLKTVYNTNDRKKNNGLVNVIKSGLNDFKMKLKIWVKKKKKLKNQMRYKYCWKNSCV